jgi:hypothetical protein
MNSLRELMRFKSNFVARRELFFKHVGNLTNYLLEFLGGPVKPDLAL